MKRQAPRFARVRGGLAAVFASAAVLVACQATLPTDADIEHMNIETATRTARELAKAKHADTTVAYTVDGVKASATEASVLDPATLDGVKIVTQPLGVPTQIHILRKHASGVAEVDSVFARGASPLMAKAVDAPVMAPLTGAEKSKSPFTGLVFIDGVRSTMTAIKALDPKQIDNIEIIKGAAAAQAYNDPAAATGVITVTTKRGGSK